LKKELLEQKCIEQKEYDDPFLYPNLNDKDFNIKIASKKEFNDTKYDGKIRPSIKDYANELSNVDFELQPHQQFVKNFLSSQTPYNSLLLFHGLGTGKTCSSIGVCEQMRDYMKQVGITKKIIIVASENVQNNFRLQLFDETKLKLVNGIWNITSCIGNKLLKEINPTNIKGISKDSIISQVKQLINSYYLFLGYGQFANYIIKITNTTNIEDENNVNLSPKIIHKLRNEFDGRMIVIDEIHNIRKSDDNENKKVAVNLELLVKHAMDMRLILLSATPMYNNYTEIVWLLNIMNMNDRRGIIHVKNIFDKNGNFKEGGEDLLIRKATGYISFVRGENPYTFPYRIYPNEFAPEHTFPHIQYPSYQMNLKKIADSDKKQILQLYLNTIDNCNNCGDCQYCAYKYIINYLRLQKNVLVTRKGVVRDMPSFEDMDKFGYTTLQNPLHSLIISYPYEGLQTIMKNIPRETYLEELTSDSVSIYSDNKSVTSDNVDDNASDNVDDNVSDNEEKESSEPETETVTSDKSSSSSSSDNNTKGGDDGDDTPKNNFALTIDPKELIGRRGLERMMTFVDTKTPYEKGQFEYKKSTLDKYGRIYSYDKIGKYSVKIKCLLDSIYNHTTNEVSEGVILVYSQYIDSALIPIALALEEMGFTRYGNNAKPLFKKRPSELIDVRTMKAPTDKQNFMSAKYSFITGDKRLSPDNDYEVKGLTNDDNKDGNKVKVVLISRAGSEGIDFKYIRQVHIMEPWYNMNRAEQIIGRAVRNFSHKKLDFEKRNVQIFLHATILGKENKEESADLYVYRFAELKAIQIGRVTRVLKETAIDCILNHEQTNFTKENIAEILKEPITQELSTGLTIRDYKIGDEPYSSACDYMATCEYSCRPDKEINDKDINSDTYNEAFITMNNDKIMQRIRMLMKESYFYKKNDLINAIQISKSYPIIQIYSSLSQLIDNENEFITDRYGRIGKLINIDEYYLFQPLELKNKNISIFDRTVPIDYKHDAIHINIGDDNKKAIDKRNINELDTKNINIEKGKKIITELRENYDITNKFIHESNVPRGDANWYKHCGIVIQTYTTEYPEMKDYLLQFLIAHMIEELLFKDKLIVMNYLYSVENENIEKNSFDWYMKSYFEDNMIITKKFKVFIMYEKNKRKIMILNNTNEWIESKPEDQREIAMAPETKNAINYDTKELNKYVGFFGYKKTDSNILVFKTRDTENKRDTGATCEEAGKDKTIQKLNLIIGETKYTKENTKQKKNSKGVVVKEAIGQVDLCIMQEFMLRYYNVIKKNSKRWFLTPEMALYHGLYKIMD
jgi:hypothetical protein